MNWPDAFMIVYGTGAYLVLGCVFALLAVKWGWIESSDDEEDVAYVGLAVILWPVMLFQATLLGLIWLIGGGVIRLGRAMRWFTR